MGYIIARRLDFDVTRYCNLVCRRFCFRGKAEDISIIKGTVYNTLKHLRAVVSVHLDGGEIFGKPDVIESITDEIEQSGTPIAKLVIISNFTIWTPEIERALRKLINVMNVNLRRKFPGHSVSVKFYISDDEHHEKAIIKAGITEDERLKTAQAIKDFIHSIGGKYDSNTYEEYEVVAMGYAEGIGKRSPHMQKTLQYAKSKSGNIFISDSLIINVYGKVFLNDISWKMQDQGKYIVGDINEEPLSNILERVGEEVELDKEVGLDAAINSFETSSVRAKILNFCGFKNKNSPFEKLRNIGALIEVDQMLEREMF